MPVRTAVASQSFAAVSVSRAVLEGVPIFGWPLMPPRPSGPASDIAEIVRRLLEEGWEIDPEDLAQVSP